jgi:pilus assembly protein CpaF
MLSSAEAEFLASAVGERKNILISGATGTGKTTLLASLVATASSGRVLVLEDVPELARVLPQAIGLNTREPNIEGKGEVNLSRLLREALRMRPDRILVGEVRGPEFSLLLQALNTGHSGAGSTVHADSIRDVPARLGALAQLSGLDAALANQLIIGAIDIVAQLDRVGTRRHLSGIARPVVSGGVLGLELLSLAGAGAPRLAVA